MSTPRSLFLLLAGAQLLAGSALANHAYEMRVGETLSLPSDRVIFDSCEGTVNVNNDVDASRLNIVFTNVKNCTFYKDTKGNSVRLSGTTAHFNGAFTITTAKEETAGWHSVAISLHSKNFRHEDEIKILYKVVPAYPLGGYAELSRNGTINGISVMAYAYSESALVRATVLDETCQHFGYARSTSYRLRAAPAYDGELMMKITRTTMKMDRVYRASNVAILSSLNCSG